MTFELRGLAAMLDRVAKAKADLRQATEDAVREVADELLEEAKSRTPVRTGKLRDSGQVTMTSTAERIQATISFNTPYAALVHEDLAARHDHGEAKFLEHVLMERQSELAERVGQKIKEKLGL